MRSFVKTMAVFVSMLFYLYAYIDTWYIYIYIYIHKSSSLPQTIQFFMWTRHAKGELRDLLLIGTARQPSGVMWFFRPGHDPAISTQDDQCQCDCGKFPLGSPVVSAVWELIRVVSEWPRFDPLLSAGSWQQCSTTVRSVETSVNGRLRMSCYLVVHVFFFLMGQLWK